MKEILENIGLIIPVLAAVIVGIISFIISLRLRKKLDSKLAGRNEKIASSCHKVIAVRRENNTEMSMQGNPIYKNARKYFAHYDYEVNGKQYKFHVMSGTFPTAKITLMYRDNPKKAFWMYEIPTPVWIRLLRFLLWILPFAAALLIVWIFVPGL